MCSCPGPGRTPTGPRWPAPPVTASAYLAQRCVALGDAARAAALDLAGSVAAGRTVTADSAGAAAAAALRGHDDIGLTSLVGGAP